MQVPGNYRDLETLIGELKKSPEAQRLIKGGFFDSLLAEEPNSAQSTAKGEESRRPPTARRKQTLRKKVG